MATTRYSRVKPRALKISFYNADGGIHKQKDELHSFLRENQIDILLAQETHLKPSHRDPKIANYRIIRNDRTTGAGGGTLIYYKRSLHCIPMDTPPLKDLEASVCRIAMTGHQPITVASVYLPPPRRRTRGPQPLPRSSIRVTWKPSSP